MENILKDKKKVIAVIVVLLVVIGIVLWLRRRKKEESGYVMARGFFPTDGGSTPPPTAPPAPTPPPGDGAPPPGGDGIMGGPPMPPPPSGGGHPYPGPYPSWPVIPYYPAPVYYDPFPRTVVVNDTENNGRVSRSQYVSYLRKAIDSLEIAYDDAVSDFMFRRAYKISKQIDDLREKLIEQIRY